MLILLKWKKIIIFLKCKRIVFMKSNWNPILLLLNACKQKVFQLKSIIPYKIIINQSRINALKYIVIVKNTKYQCSIFQLIMIKCWHSNRHTAGRTQQCNLRSRTRWFTEFCNSHDLSHFAVPFFDWGTKVSNVKSCLYIFF